MYRKNNMTKGEILGDHYRKGKRYTPPLLRIGNFVDSKYIDYGIPEIIWIAFLNKNLGLRIGAETGLKFTQIVKDCTKIDEVPFYISWYSNLNVNLVTKIKIELKKKGMLKLLNIALSPLLNVYSECPLNNLFDCETHSIDDLNQVKEVISQLYDKTSNESTFSLGNVMYFLIVNDKMKIVRDSALAQLPELIDYPNTELSKMIASGVRASSNIILNKPFITINETWIKYFWNRGIQLEPCVI